METNYNELISDLVVISESIRKYQHNFVTSMATLEDNIVPFTQKITQITDSIKIRLLEEYSYELIYILNALRSIKSKKLQSFCDKILIENLQLKKSNIINISYIFEEFIKGITYFRYQQENKTPIYHRLYSCGLKQNSDKLECTHENRKTQRKFTETCYIERLIYGELLTYMKVYASIESSEPSLQDKQHIERLEITRQQYKTCFPNSDITIEIGFENSNTPIPMVIPIRLTLIRLKNDNIISTETYVKSRVDLKYIQIGQGLKYSVIVDCYKIIKDKQYIKFQSFFGESRWTSKKNIIVSENPYNTISISTKMNKNNTV